MITPETKDWTWVLDRRCPDCGFEAGAVGPTEVAALVRANAATWRRYADAGLIHPGRPDDHTWSTLEYACHVRDVFTRMEGRVRVMLADDDPSFPNWDQDTTAVEDRYETQDPATVVTGLEATAAAYAATLDSIRPGGWGRPGVRSDGARFTVATLARYSIHDPVHHCWDVSGEVIAP